MSHRTLVLGLILAALALGSVPVAAQDSIPPRPRRTSWTVDGNELQVGDIVTVMVDEYILATADMARVDQRQTDSNQTLQGGLGSGGSTVGVRTINDASDRTRGENTRREAFTAQLSARVVEVAPNGLLRVEGTKSLKIDEHQQSVTLRGWVRPRDVTSANTVASARLADAEILYDSNGALGAPDKGLIARILGFIF